MPGDFLADFYQTPHPSIDCRCPKIYAKALEYRVLGEA